MLSRTPLYEKHVALKAKLLPFAGWEMPISYSSIIEEHQAVRNQVGIFDICHMGTFMLLGEGARALIQKIATNDLERLRPFRVQYSILCNGQGGVIDDILVYRIKDKYMLVANASNAEKVYNWVNQNNSFGAQIIDQRKTHGSISIQGPLAEKIVKAVAMGVVPLKKNDLVENFGLIISRTGYTGEDGFEFFCPVDKLPTLWDTLLDSVTMLGGKPCGLGARDTLRLEAGLPLYGHEYDEQTTPVEAGYAWAIKFDKNTFIGKDALKTIPPKKKLIGITLEQKVVPRSNYNIFASAEMKTKIGLVTSGTFSPSLGKPIALAYISSEFNGKIVFVEIRGKAFVASVVALPFYKKGG